MYIYQDVQLNNILNRMSLATIERQLQTLEDFLENVRVELGRELFIAAAAEVDGNGGGDGTASARRSDNRPPPRRRRSRTDSENAPDLSGRRIGSASSDT